MSDVLGSEPRRLGRRVPLLVLGALVAGLLVTVLVRDGLADREVVALELVGAAAPGPAAPVAAVPRSSPVAVTPAAPPTGPVVRDALVALQVRNTGPFAVEVLDQRLDAGTPVDRTARSLAVDGTAGVEVRWRVLCDEVGSLYGPRRLDLTVRPRRGGARTVSLVLDDATRRTFRLAASTTCAAG